MADRKRVLAISGSTRKDSINGTLINIIARSNPSLDFTVYNGLSNLPHFNPDEDNEGVSPLVTDLRSQIKESDGVLICTPEYAMGLPGTLKNALDWTVSSGEFSHKPVLAITASLSGEKAHASLLSTLRIIEANIPDELQLLIPFAKTKIRDDKIMDEKTATAVQHLMEEFLKILNLNGSGER